jgi:hypothetical protein
MTKLLKILLGNLLVLSILLIVVEIVLQIANIGGYGSAPLNPDPVLHHVHPSDYQFISYSSVGDFDPIEISYDEDGLIRAPYLKDKKREEFRDAIVFMGDSFVESNQAEYDSSFVGRLQAQYPDIEMLNYGVSSYSPALYYLLVKHKIADLSPLPSKVFIMLYSNDVRDDENYLADAVFDESNDLIAIDGGTPGWFISTMRRSHLFRLLRKAQVTIKFMLREKNKEEEKSVVGDYLEENPDWEGTQSAEYMLKTARLLDAKNINLYLTVVPSKYNHFFHDYTHTEFSDKVGEWAAGNGISFIDLKEPFRNWRSQHDGSLFFNKDIHFNNTGHDIVAGTIAAYIADTEVGLGE